MCKNVSHLHSLNCSKQLFCVLGYAWSPAEDKAVCISVLSDSYLCTPCEVSICYFPEPLSIAEALKKFKRM